MSKRKSWTVEIKTKNGLVIKSQRITALNDQELDSALEALIGGGGELETAFNTLGVLGLVMTIKGHDVEPVQVCTFTECAHVLGVPLWYEQC